MKNLVELQRCKLLRTNSINSLRRINVLFQKKLKQFVETRLSEPIFLYECKIEGDQNRYGWFAIHSSITNGIVSGKITFKIYFLKEEKRTIVIIYYFSR